MDELDNDFKELCANLLSRVKKKAGDAEGVRKVQSRTRSIATKSKLKKSKSAAKSKSQHDSSAGKRMGEPECTDLNGQALGQEPGGKATPCGNDGPPLGGGNGDSPSAIQLDAMSPNCNQNNLAGNFSNFRLSLTLKYFSWKIAWGWMYSHVQWNFSKLHPERELGWHWRCILLTQTWCIRLYSTG